MTKLVYRGVAYIKDDKGRYSIDTSSLKEKSFTKKSLVSV